MTYKEYLREYKIKKDNREGIKKIIIILCIFLIIASMFICADKCSDGVFGWVMGLNCLIWIFCFFILELKDKKDKLELKLLSQKVEDEDAYLICLKEEIEKNPFI